MNISVIIPVYNVENYLRQCLDSVINQDVYEIICVNDSSTDSSPQILNEYKDKIKIINNKKNLGLGLSRNEGFKIATGDYIHFLDSDDWMEDNAYSKMKEYLEKTGEIDVLHFLWNEKCTKTGAILPCYAYNKEDLIEKVTNIKKDSDIAYNWCRSAWCKLYKKSFLDKYDFWFNDYRCLEDIEYSAKVLTLADSIYFVRDFFVDYRVNNPDSLMGVRHKFYNCALDSYHTNLKTISSLDKEIQVKILELELYNLLHILYNSFVKGALSRKELKNIVNSLDLQVFNDNIEQYRWYMHYRELKYDSEIYLKIKHFLRVELKTHLRPIYDLLLNVRKKYKFLRKI